MDKAKKSEKVVITVGPLVSPYGKIIRTERRFGVEDRRRLNTFIVDDRRAGLADRRDHKRFLQTR
jgi:hypothetical protein